MINAFTELEMTQLNTFGLVLFLSLILLGGCKDSKDDPNDVIFISDELNVEMWEELTATERHLVFKYLRLLI